MLKSTSELIKTESIACKWMVQRVAFILCLSIILTITVQAKDNGRDLLLFTVNGIEIKVFTYRPPDCENPEIFLVFHGIKRTARKYRNRAIDVAKEACLMVFAPKFDKARFPSWRYERAGVTRKGKLQDRTQWTAPILRELIKFARREVKSKDAEVYLFGHSAGAQFLSRIAAYTPLSDVDRIIIANPSAHVAPVLNEAAPYGFGNVFSEFKAYSTMKAYLASPISIYLGQQDTGNENLVNSKAAKRQGKNRLERGQNVFYQASEIARKKNWEFNWILVEVPKVGHSSGKMLRAPELFTAFDMDDDMDSAKEIVR